MFKGNAWHGIRFGPFAIAAAVLVGGAVWNAAIAQNRGGSPPAPGSSAATTTAAATRKMDVEALLNRDIPQVDFKDTPLADAIDRLKSLSGLNIAVDWDALKTVKVEQKTAGGTTSEQKPLDQKTPVSLSIGDLPLTIVLEIILQQAAPGKLGFKIEDNGIRVTTLAEIAKSTKPPTTMPRAR